MSANHEPTSSASSAGDDKWLSYEPVKHYDQTRRLPEAAHSGLIGELARAARSSSRPVADVGAGSGRFALPLAKAAPGAPVIAVDVSAAMLGMIRDKRPPSNLAILRGSAVDVPLRDGSAGVCVLAAVLHVLANWPLAVAEAVRITSREGAILVMLKGEHADGSAYKAITTEARRQLGLPPDAFSASVSADEMLAEFARLGWHGGPGEPHVGDVREVPLEMISALCGGSHPMVWDLDEVGRSRLRTDLERFARRAFGDPSAPRLSQASWRWYTLTYQ